MSIAFAVCPDMYNGDRFYVIEDFTCVTGHAHNILVELVLDDLTEPQHVLCVAFFQVFAFTQSVHIKTVEVPECCLSSTPICSPDLFEFERTIFGDSHCQELK